MKILSVFLAATLVIFSCNKQPLEVEKPDPIIPSTISFSEDVMLVFNTHCNGVYCHGGGADGKYFDTYSNVMLVPSVTLLGAINHTAGFEPMPKSQPKLRQGEIDTITAWINEGRIDN